MKNIFIKTFTLVGYVAMVAVNYLAVTLPIGGRDTGAISDSYPNLFAPAGYTFSIWGLIYTLLALYTVYQFTRKNDDLTSRVNRLFIPNALLNAAWIFAWHYDIIWLSLVIMVGLLFTLIKIADIVNAKKLSAKDSFFVRLPFSVYFGWITVATIANIIVFLVSIGWGSFGLSEVFWTVCVLLAGAAIGSWRALKDKNIAYALVLVWAYGGILAKHISLAGFAGRYGAIMTTAVVCMLAFAGIAGYITRSQK